MKKTSSKMNRYLIAWILAAVVIAALSLVACRKDKAPRNENSVTFYSAEVLDKWISLQLRLMRNATGIPNQAFSRHFAYTGLAALESLAPGLSPSLNQYRKWNGLTGLPVFDNSF